MPHFFAIVTAMKVVIQTAIEDVMKELGLTAQAGLPVMQFTQHQQFVGAGFSIEHPSDFTNGDYATNVAMVLAGGEAKPPRQFAEEIVAKLEGQIEYVDKIEIAGPGFINFYLAREFFTAETARVLKEGDKWGHNDSWKDKTVLVEYTDPNPFKEFHIGHLFTNMVGESIARLFIATGADVRRVNYQGDIGLHVACAIYGMQQLNITAESEFTAKDLGLAYAKGATANKDGGEASVQIKAINKAIYERSDEGINILYDKGRQISLDYFETIYQIVDTKFDHYFFESIASPKGKELVLNNPEIFPESNGARIFKGEDYGLHSRVFLNSQGLPTYEAKELALSKLKDEYVHYDYSVISTAKEINEYFKVLLKAMEFVYPELAEKTEHIGHGMVRLETGKMSSRTGDVISAIDFIDEITDAAEIKMKESNVAEANRDLARDIAIGAIKYATLKGSIYQDTVFNKKQALSFEGASGPYLQYTHARITSVLEKAKTAGVEQGGPSTAPVLPYNIEKILYRFPEVVEEAFINREPHHVATFLIELTSAFNSFYATERIADPEDKYAPYKVLLAKAVKQTVHNGLWILGIKAPEKM